MGNTITNELAIQFLSLAILSVIQFRIVLASLKTIYSETYFR